MNLFPTSSLILHSQDADQSKLSLNCKMKQKNGNKTVYNGGNTGHKPDHDKHCLSYRSRGQRRSDKCRAETERKTDAQCQKRNRKAPNQHRVDAKDSFLWAPLLGEKAQELTARQQRPAKIEHHHKNSDSQQTAAQCCKILKY